MPVTGRLVAGVESFAVEVGNFEVGIGRLSEVGMFDLEAGRFVD